MGFFSPWFLAGLAAVGLPVWIHLLKRHKTDPRLFPSLMLFEKREVSSVKHRRLEHLLLFALRAAMVILLALLFANPFIRRAGAVAQGKRLTVVAVDDSFSMRAGDRLQRAKDEAVSILSKLNPGDQAQVVALAGQVQALTQPVADPAALRAAVAAIQPGDSRASFGELARYTRTLAESVKMPLEVHLISDLQKSAMPPGFTDLRLDPSTRLVFHQIGQAAPNWTVENVNAPARIYDPKKVRVEATIAGFNAPAAKRTVSLVLNGKTLQTKTADVPENGRAQVEFLGLDAPYGFSRGEVRIDSADTLPADDRFPFAVERTDPRKVLFLDEGRRGNAQLFYRSALDASPDAAFQMEALPPEQAANIPLSHYAFVVLSDLGSISPALETALDRYVTAGGSVLIALGPASAAMTKVPLIDEPIQASTYAGREGERFLSVSDIDAGHPALRSVERLADVKFYLAVHVNPTKSQVLARLNDQTPLVLERKIGEGTVLVFTSTFDNVSNDLPLHAAWVPFVQQSAAYLGGSASAQPVNVTVDSYIELRSADSKGTAAEVLGPDGTRLLSLEEAASARNFAVRKEGFFELKAANGKRSLLAVHADRRESDLTVIPQESLDLWKATGESDQSGGGASGSAGSADKTAWPLAPILLLVLLGVALAESVVADRYLSPPVEEQPGRRKEAA
ncbi:MAG TPA: BatA domain-containing protein [Bryobacteraceae bacterium]|nr:BatA domain-containing protein [Bryobacteraceae bacterium]